MLMNYQKFDERRQQEAIDKYVKELMMIIVREMKIDPKNDRNNYVVLRDSLLKTQEKHDASQAIGALMRYIQKGDFMGFTSRGNARFNLENFRSTITPSAAKVFIDHVSKLAYDRMNAKSLNSSYRSAQGPSQNTNANSQINSRNIQRNRNYVVNNHNGLYIVSDFHGEIKALNKAIEKVNLGKKVIILGDITDRGENGLEMLRYIVQTQEKIGDKIEYIPGNHDEFLYGAIYDGMRNYEKTGDIGELQRLGIKSCDAQINNQAAIKNGQASTYQKLRNMLINNPQEVYKIGMWLEQQPLLRIEYDKEKSIALGHAAFDMDLFKRGYNLRNYFDDQEKQSILYEKARLCLWYRDNIQSDIQSARQNLILPNKNEATDIIVGHTPFALQVNLEGKNGNRTALCVDSGHHSSKNQQWMLNYDSRRENVDVTVFYPSQFPEPQNQEMKNRVRGMIREKVSQMKSNIPSRSNPNDPNRYNRQYGR